MKNKIMTGLCIVLCGTLCYGLFMKEEPKAEPKVPEKQISDAQYNNAKKTIKEISNKDSEIKYLRTLEKEKIGNSIMFSSDGLVYELSEDGKTFISMYRDPEVKDDKKNDSKVLNDNQLLKIAEDIIKQKTSDYKNYRVTRVYDNTNDKTKEYTFEEYLNDAVLTGAYIDVFVTYSGELDYIYVVKGNPALVKDKTFAVNSKTIKDIIDEKYDYKDYKITKQYTTVYLEKTPVYIVHLEENGTGHYLMFDANTKEVLGDDHGVIRG